MSIILRTVALSLGSFVAARAMSQSATTTPQEWNEAHYKRKTEAMDVLFAWGSANVLVGGVGAITSDREEWRQFHLMSAGWGAINAALGFFGRRSAISDGKRVTSLERGYKDLRKTEKILLFNAGLDVGYMMGGAYLLQRARKEGNENQRRDEGWGESILLQGFGLFAFDLLAYRHLHRGDVGVLPVLTDEGLGLSLTKTF